MKGLGLLVGTMIGLLLHLGGCKKDPVGPPPPTNPREYTWTVDTLAYPGSFQTVMRHIWGSSSSDIYICGWNDRAFGRMYHFNGQAWTNVKLLVTEGGPLTRIGFFGGIVGFSANDIYAAGDVGPRFDPFLIHSNGSQWREINVPNGKGLRSIWGRSPENIWVGGWDGFLAHYNGSQFTRDSVPYTFVRDSTQNTQITQITGNASTTYLVVGNAPYTVFFPFYYLYERVGSQWTVRDSSYEFARVFLSPGGTLYWHGPGGVLQRTGNSWTPVLSQLATVGMGAAADNSIFAVGYGPQSTGRVYHFNGSDWFEYEHLRMDNVAFNSVWTDGREVFVVGISYGSPTTTIVLHGK